MGRWEHEDKGWMPWGRMEGESDVLMGSHLGARERSGAR